MGVPGRAGRGPALPPGDELERGAAPLVGPVRYLEGWLGDLGRDRRRDTGRTGRVAPARCRHPAVLGCRRPGAAGGAGDRAHRELLQPGALRRPHLAALGAGRRPRPPAGRLYAVRNLSPDVPVRDRLEPGSGRRARVAGAPPPNPRSRLVRALRRRLLAWADRRGAAARGPCTSCPRPAPELLRGRRPVRGRASLVLPHPAGSGSHPAPVRGAAARGRRGRSHVGVRPRPECRTRPGFEHPGCHKGTACNSRPGTGGTRKDRALEARQPRQRWR